MVARLLCLPEAELLEVRDVLLGRRVSEREVLPDRQEVQMDAEELLGVTGGEAGDDVPLCAEFTVGESMPIPVYIEAGEVPLLVKHISSAWSEAYAPEGDGDTPPLK